MKDYIFRGEVYLIGVTSIPQDSIIQLLNTKHITKAGECLNWVTSFASNPDVDVWHLGDDVYAEVKADKAILYHGPEESPTILKDTAPMTIE